MTDEKKPKTPTALYKKVLAVQKAVGAIPKTKENPFFKSNYFDINALLEVVKPALEKEGLLIIQPLRSEDGNNFVGTYIIDPSTGEEIGSMVRLPDQPDPQKLGSAITYYRRYALQSILALEAADDDGNAASSHAGGKTHASTKKTAPAKESIPVSSGKAWMKDAKDEAHECKTCSAPAKRAYGVSKKDKEFNMLKCTESDDHMEWLDVNPDEMISF